jgi:polysaccharide pyruvyl transferase WcaK-like protein
LPFLAIKFLFFKVFGLKVKIIAQGAGPVDTAWGKFFTRFIMKLVDSASFRDHESLQLISNIAPCNIEKYSMVVDGALYVEQGQMKKERQEGETLLLGLNLRRWFHFDGNWLPFEYRVRLGLLKEIPGTNKMKFIVERMSTFLDKIMENGDVKVRMVPMYPPNIETWEDDLDLLRQVRARMKHPEFIEIMDEDLTPEELIKCFSEMDMMIGMRLHSTIIPTALGIPSIHLAYSPKGYSYFRAIGQEEYCFPIERLVEGKGWEELSALFDELMCNRKMVSKKLLGRINMLKRESAEHLSDSIYGVSAGPNN